MVPGTTPRSGPTTRANPARPVPRREPFSQVVRPSPTQGAQFPVTVDVDLPAPIRARCTELGDGALYAVKTLARQPADDPRLGERAGRLGSARFP